MIWGPSSSSSSLQRRRGGGGRGRKSVRIIVLPTHGLWRGVLVVIGGASGTRWRAVVPSSHHLSRHGCKKVER